MFYPVESSVSFPKLEEKIIRFWKARQIYEKSLQARAGAPAFVFYEGPPTANGLPHPGHCLTRAIKDLFPRYKTMRGYRCERKGGWDTHGLPVEVEVCKELGIHSKEEIEDYGVEPFIHRCLQSVFRYTREWEQLTERLGFWIHLDEAYVTFHQSYVESVWWSLKNLFDRGLLYQGHKIVWWWAQGGTALSSGEVGQGYREVADPSVYVRFPLVDTRGEGRGARGEGEANKSPLPLGEGQGEGLCDADLLVWTTTPWTLPSNQFAAVRPDLEYSVVAVEGESRRLVMASALVEEIASKSPHGFTVESTLAGKQLIGRRYIPPFDDYYKAQGQTRGKLKGGGSQHVAWRVVAADFVTTDSGTGVVHQAPAFGEVDFDVLLEEQERFVAGDGPPLICSVAPDGTFTAESPDYQGRWVKDADRDIIRDMKQRGLLFHQEQYVHDYPFCPRAEEDPLIQYPRRSWFIRTTEFKDKMLKNNRRINWLPEHIRDGRFGNFLETNVDWALSRERYWGTPLPIWVCEESGYMEAVAGYDDLLAKPGVAGTEVWEKAKAETPDLPDDLKVHKPYIDAVTYDSPRAPGKRMRRVPEVIDCWFDAGAMPFAQWGYPREPGSVERFDDQFPADFISEALDQTRGWFYGLLAISTLLFSEESPSLEEFQRPVAEYLSILSDCIESAKSYLKEERHKQAEEVLTKAHEILDADPDVQERLEDAQIRRLRQQMLQADKAGKKELASKLRKEVTEKELAVYEKFRERHLPVKYDVGLRYQLAQYYKGRLKQSPKTDVTMPARAYPHPYRNCIVLGLILGEDGEKMSKRKRNYREPNEIFDRYGADALRWYFLANQPPWTLIRFSERSIKECIPEFLLRLWNVYSFFVIYANIDGFDPAGSIPGDAGQLTAEVLAASEDYRPIRRRGELDRWVLSELSRTAAAVVERMDAYDNYAACLRLTEFLDALSNWYVRRSRDRFWSSRQSADKTDAYWTLYECLLTTGKLIAPFVPFLAEEIWQNLAVEAFGDRVAESVHLCDYPQGDPAAVDQPLSERMALVREIVSLGRSARMGAKLKVRQPLSLVEVILADPTHQPWLQQHAALICEELNVKRVDFARKADQYITYTVLPDLKRLGPRLGKRLPGLRRLLSQTDGGGLLAELEAEGKTTLELPDGPVELDSDDLQVRLQAKDGWAAAQGPSTVVVLSTELSEDLILEGLARELVHAVQNRRKQMNCQYTDRIAVGVVTDSDQLQAATDQFQKYIQGETLAVELGSKRIPGAEPVELTLAGHKLTLCVKVVAVAP